MEPASDILILQNSIKYLRRHLIFPTKEDVNRPGFKFYMKFFILSLSTATLLIGNMMHMVVNIRRKTYINMDLDLTLSVSLIGSYLFNYSYLRQVNNVIRMYKQLSNFEAFGTPDDFQTANKKLNYFSTCHYVYIIWVIIGVSVAPLLEYNKCKRENLEQNIHEICGIIGGIWVPFDLDHVPYKQIYYLFQAYSAFMIYMTSSLISVSIVETVEHVIVRLRHVKNAFLAALAEKDYREQKKKLGKAVDYHVAIFGMVKFVNKCFNMCMFVHIVLTGAILGCTGYRLIRSYSLGAICTFIGWMLSMIMVCISGQRMSDESLSVADIVDKFKWEDLSMDLQRDLIIIMMRCQKPIYLNAGAFGYMRHAMILTVLKTSYSYLTLLSRTS